MRLVCPNCEAQYEVPVEVIPTEGRDVQCSNCGVTWFQHHPDHEPDPEDIAAPEPEAEIDAAEDEHAEVGDAPEGERRFDPAAEDVFDDDDDALEGDGSEGDALEGDAPDYGAPEYDAVEDDALDDEADGFDAEPDDDDVFSETEVPEPPADEGIPPPPLPQRRELPEEVKSVLQQEAEFNRRTDAPAPDPLESQPDLPLAAPETDAQRREREGRERMAKLRGKPVHPTPPPVTEDGTAASRRELLPDIEEINSSLGAKSEEIPQMPERDNERTVAQDQRRSFRTGFGFVLLLMAVLILLYIQADRISEQLPAIADEMQAYVTLVNSFRFWLDAQVGKLLIMLNEMSAE